VAKLRTPEAVKEAREAGLEKTELVIALRAKIAELEAPKATVAVVEYKVDEQELSKQGKRIVAMTDVTVTRDALLKAVKKSNKLPGNEVQAFVDFLLKEIIMEKKDTK